MNKEIEAKFKIDDVDNIRSRILDLGAKFISTKEQKDIYFINCENQNLRQDFYLRVRQMDGKFYTALHRKLDSYEWIEIEVEVSDGEDMKNVYFNLGFEIDVEVKKTREVYKLLNAEIVLDCVVGLGFFLEVEAASKEALLKYCNDLGFSCGETDQLEGKSYADLVKEAKDNNKLTGNR